LGEPRAWLFGIARHLLARSLEAGRVENETRCAWQWSRWCSNDEDLERINELNGTRALTALESLPLEQQAAVSGRVLAEADYAELASELRCSESVVRQRVSRGLRQLRKSLEGKS